MPAHPVSRLVRFTLAVNTNVIFDHFGHRRPTGHAVRVIEAVELVACDVEPCLARLLAAHPGDCGLWAGCVLAPQVRAQRVYAIPSGWQRQVRAQTAPRYRVRRCIRSTVLAAP
jgi:hypothetical protein